MKPPGPTLGNAEKIRYKAKVRSLAWDLKAFSMAPAGRGGNRDEAIKGGDVQQPLKAGLD